MYNIVHLQQQKQAGLAGLAVRATWNFQHLLSPASPGSGCWRWTRRAHGKGLAAALIPGARTAALHIWHEQSTPRRQPVCERTCCPRQVRVGIACLPGQLAQGERQESGEQG